VAHTVAGLVSDPLTLAKVFFNEVPYRQAYDAILAHMNQKPPGDTGIRLLKDPKSMAAFMLTAATLQVDKKLDIQRAIEVATLLQGAENGEKAAEIYLKRGQVGDAAVRVANEMSKASFG
jgi:hypothetical protein